VPENADIEFVVHHEGLFGAALHEFRQRAGLNQAELADRIDEHRSYLSAVENGRSTKVMRVLLRACRELDVEIVVRPVRRQ